MLKIFSRSYLSSNAGAANYYFIGIGALVIILVVAAAAIFLSPDIRSNLVPSQDTQTLEKSKVAGQIVDIDYDEDYFVVEDTGTGEEFKINLPEGMQIKTGGSGSGIYTLSDLEIGQYIELINVKYTSSGGGSGGGGSSGGSSGGGVSGGSNNNDGGSNNNGGGDNNQNEVDPDDWEDIYVYFPFPAFSSKVLSIDSLGQTIKVETVTSPKKTLNVLVTVDTEYASFDKDIAKSKIVFGDIKVNSKLDIFTEEDPSDKVEVTALLVIVTNQ